MIATMAQPLVSRSRYSFAQTVERLTSAIHAAGGTLFATIDQQAAAEAVGLTLRPTTLLIFGNARGGTPFMEAFPLVALELPLKVLVWETNGVVNVAAVLPSLIAERYNLVGHADLVAALDVGVRELVASVE
jgi:uncharacterized protein (DUF302 family)